MGLCDLYIELLSQSLQDETQMYQRIKSDTIPDRYMLFVIIRCVLLSAIIIV